MLFPCVSSLNHKLRIDPLSIAFPPFTIPGIESSLCLKQISGDEFFADVAADILLYVSRDLSDRVSRHLSSGVGSLASLLPSHLVAPVVCQLSESLTRGQSDPPLALVRRLCRARTQSLCSPHLCWLPQTGLCQVCLNLFPLQRSLLSGTDGSVPVLARYAHGPHRCHA